MAAQRMEISFWQSSSYYGSLIETPIMLEQNANLNLLFRVLFLTTCYTKLNVKVEHTVVSSSSLSNNKNHDLLDKWEFSRRPDPYA